MTTNRKKFGNPAAEFLAGDAEPTRSKHECAAYGCPLAGSVSPSTNGGGPWYCYLHFGLKPARNDQITARINANLWIPKLWARVQRLDPRDWEKVRELAAAHCARHERQDLEPTEGEHQSRYVWRLQCNLKAIVFPRNDREDVAEPVELLEEAA